MSFEKEKEFMIEALEDNYSFNAEHIQEEVDTLYDLFQVVMRSRTDEETTTPMLLSLYYRSKAVSHHIQILKSVLEPLWVDPFALPYHDWGKKFQDLIEEFKLNEYKLLSGVVPPITGVRYGLNVDYCMLAYGVTEENLFLPVMDKVNKCMLEPGHLSEASSILSNNRRYLFVAVTDNLNCILDGLAGIVGIQFVKHKIVTKLPNRLYGGDV